MNAHERPTRKFVTRYYHDGTWWAMTIDVYDPQDAHTRCRKLGLQLDGESIFTIPGWVPCAPWVANAICEVRNVWRYIWKS